MWAKWFIKFMTAKRVNTLLIRKIQTPQTEKTRKRVVDALVNETPVDNVGGNKSLLGLLTEFVMVGGDFV